MNKIIIYVDMDDTLFDYTKHLENESKINELRHPQSKKVFIKDCHLKKMLKKYFYG